MSEHEINTYRDLAANAGKCGELVTVGGINLASGELISCRDFDDDNPLHIPCCRKDRADELLAAERAEKEELDAECRVLAKRCIEKDARIKELDWKAHNAALSNKIGEDSAPMLWSEYAETLEAKLAAKDETIRRQDIALRGALLEVERLKADNAAKDAQIAGWTESGKLWTAEIRELQADNAAKDARIKKAVLRGKL